ncbi:hypothetical protein ACQ5SO_12480 [Rhodovulum sp. DZ06]|uniref:hypothetical protein n=1 Tax=Rhodovulum sp. DZ06 TaxID=3425126 RepID=UPI003D328189
MLPLILPVLGLALLWLMVDAHLRDRMRGARVEAAAPDAQAEADPALLRPGLGILHPTGARLRLGLVATFLGSASLALTLFSILSLDPRALFIPLLLCGPMVYFFFAIRSALELVIATERGVLRHRGWISNWKSWDRLERVDFHDGKLLLTFDDGFLSVGRNMSGRGWLAFAARERLAARMSAPTPEAEEAS